MKKRTKKKAMQKADPIYKDVATILKEGDAEQRRLLRLFISTLSVIGPRKTLKIE